ncbi:hypothetical protein DEO23_10115 [Brachybacterium endophyticum]|uniref:Glycosyltransferase RgtA/B/C/D-like domain-containing protein n=1 Tax=Brachybacterium endophyticum TaxID=2182385 RepID=A0A2U2RJZ0_9MICO|nr:hypothetical protein [Brachybacterium endophyticum]PWH06151.1 hypothetical protein DEO23_10115 [Brachybacterium endophyticum]
MTILACVVTVLFSSAIGVLLLHRAYGPVAAGVIVVLSQGLSLVATAERYVSEIADPHYVDESTDAFRYIEGARARWEADVPPLDGITVGDGTNNMYVVGQWFFTVFGDDKAAVFLAGSTVGLVGLWLSALAIRIVVPDAPVVLGFLATAAPSVAYWSSSFGKDSLTFLSVGMCLWSVAAMTTRRRVGALPVLVFMVGDALMLLIRIDIGVVLLVALAVAITGVRDGSVVRFRRVVLGVVFVGAPVGLLVASALHLDDPWGVVSSFSGTADRTAIGGSSVGERQGSSLAGVISGSVTALLRPLPWEFGIGGLVSCVDTIAVLVLIWAIVRALRGRFTWGYPEAFCVVFGAFFAIAVFAELTQIGNVGLLVRLRSLIVPVLLMIIAALWSCTDPREVEEPVRASGRRGGVPR